MNFLNLDEFCELKKYYTTSLELMLKFLSEKLSFQFECFYDFEFQKHKMH